jgi:hypothetical protein
MQPIALRILFLAGLTVACLSLQAQNVTLAGPDSAPRFELAEFAVTLESAPKGNPFTDVEFTGEFTLPDDRRVQVLGFCDSQDGRVFRLRFCPELAGAVYPYRLRLRGADLDWQSTGRLRCDSSSRPGPVVADPEHPRHFIRAGTPCKRPPPRTGH